MIPTAIGTGTLTIGEQTGGMTVGAIVLGIKDADATAEVRRLLVTLATAGQATSPTGTTVAVR